jgi:hypothetical protein
MVILRQFPGLRTLNEKAETVLAYLSQAEPATRRQRTGPANRRGVWKLLPDNLRESVIL